MGQKAVILDADNTLWKLQTLYDQVREEFLSFLEGKGIDRQTAETTTKQFSAAYIQKINPATGQKYLYTAARLPASFEATLRFFIPDAAETDVRFVHELATSVFDKKAEPMEYAGQMLVDLKQAGYFLVVLTKGEDWVQKKRLQEFPYIGLIDETIIVDDKTTQIFADTVAAYNIDPARSFSIGDSINADIIPADGAGLNTILFLTHTWALERQGAVPVQTKIAKGLDEVMAIVKNEAKPVTPFPGRKPAP